MDPPAPKKGVRHTAGRIFGVVNAKTYYEVRQVSLGLEIGGCALARGLRAPALPCFGAAVATAAVCTCDDVFPSDFPEHPGLDFKTK